MASQLSLKVSGVSERLLAERQSYLSGKDSDIRKGVEADLRWQDDGANHHILTWAHTDYPPQLREIKDPPPVLFVKGDLTALSLPQVAIVGSRHCSRNGQTNSEQFARYFAQSGIVTTSGLALGIDTAAHKGALAAGSTVAVLAHGLDSLYPPRNRQLAAQIADQGALVSEMPIGIKPRPEYFPRRNRIISGLSLGVLVVEATLKSGSLITAYEALEQNREVFALPGYLHDPLAKGCHDLIRRGAKLVETAQQVVEELSSLLGYMSQFSFPVEPQYSNNSTDYPAQSTEAEVLKFIEYAPLTLDQLLELTQLPVSELASALVMLEVNGDIQQQASGYSLR